MSFSIASALALLMTLGQVFLNDGEFKAHYGADEHAQAVDLLSRSCRMILEEEEIKGLAPDMIMPVLQKGLVRQEVIIKKKVDSFCAEKIKADPAATCDRAEALESIQSKLPKLASPISEPLKIFSDFSMKDAVKLYFAICAKKPTGEWPTSVSIDDVLAIYNKSAKEALAVDLSHFNNFVLPQSSLIYAGDGASVVGEVYDNESRRTWVSIDTIPEVVKQAFISAEDKNFLKHKGVDLRGVLSGFVRYFKDKKKRVAGGSTLTQQVVKNVVLTSEISLERKLKEMMIASRLEKTLSKEKILEIYLNLIFLGRNSWGLKMAMQNYFGEQFSMADIGLNEASFFAGLTHSPNRYEPEFNLDKIINRQQFVLREMNENGYITADEKLAVKGEDLGFVERRILQSSYFSAAVQKDMKRWMDPVSVKEGGLSVFSTQVPSVQKASESALQETLFQFELGKGRVNWTGPLGSIFGDAKKVDLNSPLVTDSTQWLKKISRMKQLHSDIGWPVAVVLSRSGKKIKMGYNDNGQASERNLYTGYKSKWGRRAVRSLHVGDLIFVKPQKKKLALRVLPQVQGAVVAMEAHTGRIIAMTGGSSYFRSQLNRTYQTFRGPGSTVKPFTYLAALDSGLEPDSSVYGGPVSFPERYRIKENGRRQRLCNSKFVKNYSRKSSTRLSFRRALETSNNRATVNILRSLSPQQPDKSLDYIRGIMEDFGIYGKAHHCYPVVLGSQDTSLMNMVVAYGAIANGGQVVDAHVLHDEKSGPVMTSKPQSRQLKMASEASLFQLKNILAGVVRRGTARRAMGEYKDLVGGKTGTTSGFNDAWFIGFSNDIVVGVWVGYDNGKKRLTLSGGTGGGLAAPIAKQVFDEAFKIYPPQPLIDTAPASVELVQRKGYVEAFKPGTQRQPVQPEKVQRSSRKKRIKKGVKKPKRSKKRKKKKSGYSIFD